MEPRIVNHGKKVNKGETKRMANFELLRLVSMLLVVSLHYLSKGNLLPDFTEPVKINGYLSILLESFSIVAVNAFVLLSGYFLTESDFKGKRMIELIGQVLFYTILIPVFLFLTGVVPGFEYDIYKVLNDVLPVQMEHYWFITAYVFLYVCMPVLNAAIRNMTQKQLKTITILLLFVFSIPKSLLPFTLTIDNKGYHFTWFICVYLIAAYIRLYGISYFSSRKKSVLTYLALSAAMCGCAIFAGIVFRSTGKFQDQILEVFQYNHLLNLLAAVSFFYIFYYSRISSGKMADIICKLSPFALGVYLLHEQLDVRFLWTTWFEVEKFGQTGLFLIHFAGTVLLVFIAGIFVDFIRSIFFRLLGLLYKKIFRNGRIERNIKKLDDILNNKEAF